MKPTACLLVHGFGGSPFEVLPVAEALEASGFPVSAPTLPGHDTSIDDWRRTGWKDASCRKCCMACRPNSIPM